MSRRRDSKSIQRENSRLKKKVHQLESAIKALSDDDKKPSIPKKTPKPKAVNKVCPSCKDAAIKTLDLGRFKIECCDSCSYRKRIASGN